MKKSYATAAIHYVMMLLHENNLQDQAAHQIEKSRVERLKERRESEKEQGYER